MLKLLRIVIKLKEEDDVLLFNIKYYVNMYNEKMEKMQINVMDQ